MHNQVEADADEMELAEATLMRRLSSERVIRCAGSAVQLVYKLGLKSPNSVAAVDYVVEKLSRNKTIVAPLIVSAEQDAAGRNRYGDIMLTS